MISISLFVCSTIFCFTILSLFITLIANICRVILCLTFQTEPKPPFPILLSSNDSKSVLHASRSRPAATAGDRINNLFLTLFKIGFFAPKIIK